MSDNQNSNQTSNQATDQNVNSNQGQVMNENSINQGQNQQGQVAAGLQSHQTNQNSMNQKKIIKVKKSGGDIVAVMFDDNSVANINEAIQMAENNMIAGVNTGATRGENSHKTLLPRNVDLLINDYLIPYCESKRKEYNM